MFDRSLLERLEAADRGDTPTGPRFNEYVYVESILANVRRILNDRQYCCETRTDYGIPDLNDLLGRGADSVLAVGRAVRFQIETFEPRLRDVQVHAVPDPDRLGALAFQVTAVATLGDEDRRMSFRSFVSSDKFVEVSS
jgi:type VI secretion system protein